jgi:hypothetical protein
MRNGNSSSKAARFWYPIDLPLSYEGVENGSLSGNGRTLAIRSGAVRFECDRKLYVGQVLRLSIRWPVLLDDGTNLSLWAKGRVQRSTGWEVEVAIGRHEFRTRRDDAVKPMVILKAQALAGS